NKNMKKHRLDILMTERGLAESRAQAQRLVMAGQVRVDGEVELKSATRVPLSAEVVVSHGARYVSRGGEKLEAGLIAFGLTDLAGRVCADVGASTGGFTDCLLQHRAKRVYAIDVGYGLMHWKLRNHPSVTLMERTNARQLQQLAEPVDLVTIDASFISLKVILPVVRCWFGKAGGKVVALIKPQFEVGRAEAARGEGVIRDVSQHRRVLVDVLGFAQREGFEVTDLIRSPLLGPKGNVEFLACLVFPGVKPGELELLIEKLLPSTQTAE
ncbi:MAG: TlyA family RNA methyltransferase, partial [Anaerolineaceae bacterium]|nr:TlyA family RNA methyltransferase [Anaerolineaceae bacterium]